MCDIEAIDPAATAACELIALGLNKAQIKISKKAAQLLYSGMIADSIRYTIGTVRPKTFQAAAYLIEQGADVIQCEEDNFLAHMKNIVMKPRFATTPYVKRMPL